MGSATKALIAAGLGVVLLAGAGGTFALWSDDGTLATGAITDGELSLAVGAGVWKHNGVAVDATQFKMVPGDTLTYEAAVTPTIVGDNLEAKLRGTLPDAAGSHWTVSTALPDGQDTLTAADSGEPQTVTVTVTLPEDSSNDSQKAVLSLGDLTFMLNQVDPTP